MAYLLKTNSSATTKAIGNEASDLQPFVSFSFIVAIQTYPFFVNDCGSLSADQIILCNFGNWRSTDVEKGKVICSQCRVYSKSLRQRVQIMLVDGFNP